jgi:hypothetical protein
MGKSFEMHSSCAMTLSPDTLLRAVADMSTKTLIRDDGTQMYQHLKKLQYFALGKHQLSSGTKKLLMKDLGPFLSESALDEIFSGSVPTYVPQSDWLFVVKGMGENCDAPLGLIARKMLACDEQFLEVWKARGTKLGAQAQTNLELALNPALEAWRRISPNLSSQSFLLIESALRILVDLEYFWTSEANLTITQTSRFGLQLEVTRRPMGHWLKGVMREVNCTNLLELSKVIHSKRGMHLKRTISHDLLKKWSSSKSVLMPSGALAPILNAVAIGAVRERLAGGFYVARFLTFVCDMVWATTFGPIEKWEAAQAQVKIRYDELYRLHASFGHNAQHAE